MLKRFKIFICFQENLKKFREEADRLEKSDALKKARQKYVRIYNLH